MASPNEVEFRLDFVGGWTKARYIAAQESLEDFMRRNPLVLPRETLLQRRLESAKLHLALVELGLDADFPKLISIGVRKRTMLAVVDQEDIKRLELKGTLAQYRTLYEPALDECQCPSPDCDQREICTEELLSRLAGVKQLQDLIEEEREERERRENLDMKAKKVRSEEL